MQIPLKITIRDVAHSEALEARIREKAAKLEQVHPRITSCHVVAEMPHKHKTQGKQFTIRIDVTYPGGEVVVNRDHAEDVYVAVRDAFGAAKRQLDERVGRERG